MCKESKQAAVRMIQAPLLFN